MATESAKLRLPYITAAQAQKHVTHNEALTLLDTLTQLGVLDKDLTAPPGGPAEGDCYIVAGAGGTATGAWIGWEKRVVRFIDGEWRSYLPGAGSGAGWLAYVQDEAALYVYSGTSWGLFTFTGGIWSKGSNVASAATVSLGAGGYFHVTGTTTITDIDFATPADGRFAILVFDGALTLTHNATTLILPGGANIVTAAGDACLVVQDAGDNVKVAGFWRANGKAVVQTSKADLGLATSSTDNAVVRFDGTTGGTQDNAGVFINDSGQLSVGGATASATVDVIASTYNAGFKVTATSGNPIGAGVHIDASPATGGRKYIMLSTTNGAGIGGGKWALFDETGVAYLIIVDSSGNLDVLGNITPHTDNTKNLGSASFRFGTVYAGTGTINTSGAETKECFEPVDGALLEVAKTLASNVRIFQFCDAVAKKGADGARLHLGMVYEDVVAAFAAHGLDPLRYGIVCRDLAFKVVSATATKTVTRQRTQTKTVQRESVSVADGVATLAVVTEERTVPVFDSIPIVDATGQQVLDGQGNQRIHLEPVLEEIEIEETSETIIPDLDETGAQKVVLGLRYDELAQLMMAGLAARLAALEA